MKRLSVMLLCLLMLFSFTSCSREERVEAAAAESEGDILLGRFSYTVGYSNGRYFDDKPEMIPDYGYMLRGILDFQDVENEPLMPLQEIAEAYEDFAFSNQEPMELGKEIDEKKALKLPSPTTAHERYSYAYGFILASNGIYQFGNMDFGRFTEGLSAGLFNKKAEMTEEEMNASITEYSAYVQKQYEETVGKEKKANLEEANAFMAENSKVEGIVPVNAYCQVKFNTVGPKTEQVKLGDMVKLNYRLTNLQGEVLDQGSGVVFPMDMNQMIMGFVEGCTAMSVGDSATVYVHPEHGYGERGPNGIGPNRLLIFDIDILGIEK